jgi:hypothetical protein
VFDLFHVFLYLHVMGAIVAFGPGFAAMIVGPMVAKEPQHANFYARTQVAAGRKLITPVAISMLFTGVAMIFAFGDGSFSEGWSRVSAGGHWLEVGILLYVISVVVAMAYQAPAGRKLAELTSTPPAPGEGPNPEIQKAAGRVRIGGIVLSVLTLVIVLTMVLNPA